MKPYNCDCVNSDCYSLHKSLPTFPTRRSSDLRLTIAEATTIEKIPVLPISYGDAMPLLRNLGGPVAPERWRGAVGYRKQDRKSTRLNSSHPSTSYAVFCLKKKTSIVNSFINTM